MRAAGAAPGRVLLAVALVAAISARAGAAARAERGDRARWSGSGSDAYQATERYRERFGDHAIVVLVRGDLADLVLTDNLGRLLGLEGCLSGNKPTDQAAPGGAELAVRGVRAHQAGAGRLRPGHVHQLGGRRDPRPARGAARQQGSARPQRAAAAARKLAQAQGQLEGRAGQGRATSAEQLVYAQFTRDLLQLNLRYGLGLKRLPRLDDPDFVSALVFDPARGATTPKARFAYLFPNAQLGGRSRCG